MCDPCGQQGGLAERAGWPQTCGAVRPAPAFGPGIPPPLIPGPHPPRLQVNLAVLESSGIAGAVAQLRNHRHAGIALKADDIVHRWRTAAVAALTQATGKSK